MLDRALVVNPIKNVSTGEPFNEMMTALVFLFLGRSIFKKRERHRKVGRPRANGKESLDCLVLI